MNFVPIKLIVILIKPICEFFNHRELFSSCLRDSIRQVNGLLPYPDLYPIQSDCGHFMGLILA